MQMIDENEFLTRAEAAKLHRVSIRTMKRWQAKGSYMGCKVGGRVLYSRAAILRRLGVVGEGIGERSLWLPSSDAMIHGSIT